MLLIMRTSRSKERGRVVWDPFRSRSWHFQARSCITERPKRSSSWLKDPMISGNECDLAFRSDRLLEDPLTYRPRGCVKDCDHSTCKTQVDQNP